MSEVLYEYRVYEAAPGKMAALQKRFETTTLPIFARHGITLLGFWIPISGDNSELHYIVEWPDYDTMSRTWAAFRADEEWIAARHESDKDGALVVRVRNQLWRMAPFAPKRPSP